MISMFRFKADVKFIILILSLIFFHQSLCFAVGGPGLFTDDTVPVITLLGEVEVSHEAGTVYNDAGATAIDNIDGDITNRIEISNPVDVNVPGVYIVRYNVLDEADNSAIEVTRSVTVVDIETYTVTFTAGANGSITGTTSQTVSHEDDCSAVTAIADENYSFSGWSGDYIGTENPLMLTEITENMNITANFELSDNDMDGVDSIEEMGLNGDDASYDGNGDGEPDYLQDTVASFKTLTEFGSYVYVTLAASANDHTVTLQVNLNPDDPLELGGIPEEGGEDVAFPYGFFEFIVTCGDCGEATGDFRPDVKLYLPEGSTPNTYHKYGPTPDNGLNHWYKFMSDDLVDVGADIDGNVVTLHFIDGNTGDDDLDDSNGVIVDIGAPGISNKK